MTRIETDNLELRARYYQLHAELYEKTLEAVMRDLSLHGGITIENIVINIDTALAGNSRSIARQVSKEFDLAYEESNEGWVA